MALVTLRRRAEFQRIRGGSRASTTAFLLECKPRPAPPATPAASATPAAQDRSSATGPRFGFTVTKKLGNAVVRNRIRRRLKAAVAELCSSHADARYDYVLVARHPALDHPYIQLKAELSAAFAKVHGRAGKPRPKAG